MQADGANPARPRGDRTEAELFARAAEAFERLRALEPAKRDEPLAALDPVLRREVEELLAASEPSSDDALSEERIRARANGVPWGVARGSVPEEALPERIGDLRVLRRLGAGGMGVVYEAEQEAPRRRVAVKLVRAGLAMGERLRRFRLEAEALGRLKHPGIAQIHALGTCDLGHGEQPYFVMELVEGEPLLVHAREKRLDRRARLALVAELCDAVQHAHEHGVVHRDLKPDNVLVDGAGRAKVLDFGVARVRADDVPLTTIQTAQGQIVGTLTHMAPEQLTGDPDAVGTAVDIYALGVIAFELLTGRLPHEVAGLSLTAAVRQITEIEAPRLGTLDRTLRGDVETIVAMALEPDPALRYVTAAALASDLRRHLAHEPIAARPTGPLTRALKFTRRHPGLVATILVLLVGLAASGFFAARADAALERILRLADVKLVGEYEAEADGLWPAGPARVPALESWLGKARTLLARLPGHTADLATLERNATADPAAKWQLQVQAEVVERLRAFGAAGTGSVASVEARLEFARTIEERSVTGSAARAEWARACASIADPRACPQYGGLVIEPRLGLLPLGQDPGTGLWEFWHLQTGERPREDPRWPREAVSRWQVTPEMGLVLVLLPGGTFRMGSPAGDPLASASELPAHEVTLAPFFLSKYEMTQAQWRRFTGENPSYHSAGGSRTRTEITPTHPVEQVSWNDADRTTRRLSLVLPTEAQWEYACRAGTRTRWHTGEDVVTLVGHANIADAGSTRSFSADWQHEPGFADGFDVHAPVGSFRPNGFGLHDMHGNVWEWCRDAYADYDAPLRAGDGLRSGQDLTLRVYRGGSFYFAAARARSSARNRHAPETRFDVLGVRPSMELRER